MAQPSTPEGRRPAGVSSPWSSEEGREFLQQRLAWFSRFVALIASALFVAVWIIGLLWDPSSLDHNETAVRNNETAYRGRGVATRSHRAAQRRPTGYSGALPALPSGAPEHPPLDSWW